MEADVKKIVLPWFSFLTQRISKCFSETWLNTDGQEAGLSSWDICSPLLPPVYPCVGDSAFGSLTPPWAQARKIPSAAGCAADTWEAMPREQTHGRPAAHTSSTAGRRMQQGRDAALTLCVNTLPVPLVHPPSAQGSSHSTHHAIGKMQLKNRTYYIMYL